MPELEKTMLETFLKVYEQQNERIARLEAENFKLAELLEQIVVTYGGTQDDNNSCAECRIEGMEG